MLLPESGDQVSVPLYSAVTVEVPHGLECQGNGGDEGQGPKVHVEEGIAVQDEYLVAVAVLQGETDSSAGSEGLRFHGIIHAERPFPAFHELEDNLFQVTDRQDDMGDIEAFQPLQHILQERPSVHGSHALGYFPDNGTKPGAETACQDYRFHISGTLSVS